MILSQNQLKRDRFALQPFLGDSLFNSFCKIVLQEDSKSFLKFGRESDIYRIAFVIQKTNRANRLKCSSATLSRLDILRTRALTCQLLLEIKFVYPVFLFFSKNSLMIFSLSSASTPLITVVFGCNIFSL